MIIITEDLRTLQKDACDSITVGGGQDWGFKVKKDKSTYPTPEIDILFIPLLRG